MQRPGCKPTESLAQRSTKGKQRVGAKPEGVRADVDYITVSLMEKSDEENQFCIATLLVAGLASTVLADDAKNGGVLGESSADRFRPGSTLPYHGTIQFDSADVAQMETDGPLRSLLHFRYHARGP